MPAELDETEAWRVSFASLQTEVKNLAGLVERLTVKVDEIGSKSPFTLQNIFTVAAIGIAALGAASSAIIYVTISETKPIYRDMDAMSRQLERNTDSLNHMQTNRFTNADGLSIRDEVAELDKRVTNLDITYQEFRGRVEDHLGEQGHPDSVIRMIMELDTRIQLLEQEHKQER